MITGISAWLGCVGTIGRYGIHYAVEPNRHFKPKHSLKHEAEPSTVRSEKVDALGHSSDMQVNRNRVGTKGLPRASDSSKVSNGVC